MGKRTLGLVLSSGGARGTAHVGVLKVLEAEGLRPDIIVGVSMGAEVGGLYAAGVELSRIESLWQSASFARVARHLRPTWPWFGWSSGRAIRAFAHSIVGDCRIEELPIRFAAVTTDLETGQPIVVTQGNLADTIRASLSVPGLFTPAWLHDRLCIDGGVSSPLPVGVARDLGAECVLAVDVLVDPTEVKLPGVPGIRKRETSTSSARPRYRPTVFGVLFQMSTVFQKRLARMSLEQHPPDILLQPDFSHDPPCYSRVGCGIEAGELAAKQALPAIRAAVGG